MQPINRTSAADSTPTCPTPLPALGHQTIPNPHGTQTVPQPTPTQPRSPDGRFAPEFRPNLRQTRP